MLKSAANEQRSRLAAVTRELDTLQLSRADPIDKLIPEIRAAIDLESLALYSLREHSDRWQIDRWHAHGLPSDALHARMNGLLSRHGTQGVVFYDAACPAPAQRNRLLEATSIANDARTWLESSFCREVVAPVGFANHKQHRILLCEGASLLGWFGAFERGALTATQRQLLGGVARAVGRRLQVERRLASAPRNHAALCAALTAIGAPAFVIDAHARVLAASPAAQALLSTRNASAALREALAGRPSDPSFELTEISESGLPTQWLAIARSTDCFRIAAAVAHARERWRLSPRQLAVLEPIIRGTTNVTIAAELRTSVRAVELHVTSMLDRVGVDSRAALVAAVLLWSP